MENETTGDAISQVADNILRDAAGNAFDASLHGSKKDGTPAYKADGTFRNRRKAKPSAEFEEAAERAEKPDCAALGVAVSRTFLTCCMMIGGEAWNPGEHETAALDGAWAQYFQARGVESIPPEALLLAALSAYAGPRLANSKAPSRIGSWVKEKIFRRRRNASSNLWTNGERQNEPSNEPFEGVSEEGQNRSGLRSVS